ncbi:MAG: YicC/YloC family endoribonuclease [Bacillota bacterium]
MICSMTGYGRGEASSENQSVRVEIKSVNHRFIDISVRMPKKYGALEERIKKFLKSSVSRGYLEVYCNIEDGAAKKRSIKVDKDLAVAYHQSLRELAQILDLPADFGLLEIAQFPGVITSEDPETDLEDLWMSLEQALTMAVAEMVQMRLTEGASLAADLVSRANSIRKMLMVISERSPLVVEEYRERLTQRTKEWRQDSGIEVDPARLAAEVALFADKSSISEELVRLESHLVQLERSLQLSDPVGRKLDFLVQEMNREINTIGSKASDLVISQEVVAVKSEIEKLREQVQNIE